MPPWINKYYVLDLRPKNSFVRWAVSKGYTVFMISWVNPDERLAGKTFEDYMTEGPLAALDAIADATGEREAAMIGYCLGGTLSAATLACLAARGDRRVRSATFFASLVDFSEPGELGVFIDDAQIDSLEAMMAERGYLDGRHMATTFSMLRANDLIWSFVVNNYLMGREPMPFDLLFWNADSTRMPAAMHGYYLHRMYRENLLARPGGLSLDGVPVDLGLIDIPTYIVATREDHIAPWRACHAACGLYRGQRRFVLGASGHIAGIINPPAAGKYGYWTGPVEEGQGADAWLEAAGRHEGSWWTDWHAWQCRRAGGKKVPARTPGAGALRPDRGRTGLLRAHGVRAGPLRRARGDAVLPAAVHVALGDGDDGLALGVAHLAHGPRRPAHPHLSALHPLARRHQRAGGDPGAAFHHRVIHHRGAHADHAAVLQHAGVQHAHVTHHHALADEGGAVVGGGVDDRAVLDVAARADPDVVHVAAQDAVEPDAGVRAKHDIADHRAARGDEGAGRHPRPLVAIGQEQAGRHARPLFTGRAAPARARSSPGARASGSCSGSPGRRRP